MHNYKQVMLSVLFFNKSLLEREGEGGREGLTDRQTVQCVLV